MSDRISEGQCVNLCQSVWRQRVDQTFKGCNGNRRPHICLMAYKIVGIWNISLIVPPPPRELQNMTFLGSKSLCRCNCFWCYHVGYAVCRCMSRHVHLCVEASVQCKVLSSVVIRLVCWETVSLEMVLRQQALYQLSHLLSPQPVLM